MKKIILGLALLSIGWFSPGSNTNTTASSDFLATSSDTFSVGDSSNIWKHGYFRYLDLSQSTVPETPLASHGHIYVSTDDHIYYINSAGTKTQLDE